MENFDLCSTTRLIYGRGRENDVGQIVKNHGGRKVLIHYGCHNAQKSGLLERIKRSFDRVGIEFYELGNVVVNPRAMKVYEGIELCREREIDFILAIGGSSVIDSAKAIAGGVFYDGDFWDIFTKKKHIYRSLPIGAVLTMPAAGSECSVHTIITKDIDGTLVKQHAKSEAFVPVFAILNPELTRSLAPIDMGYVCVDMFCHVLSRYFSNTQDAPLTDMICESILKTIVDNMLIVFEDPDNYEARANLMWAGTIAHSDLYGAGRQQDWSTHIIERAISTLFDTVHGAGLAVVLPAYLEFVKNHDLTRMAQFASRVFNVSCNFENLAQTAGEGISRLRDFLHSCSMPQSLGDLNIDSVHISEIVKNIDFEGNETIGTYRELNRIDCSAILTLANNFGR